MKKTKMLKKNYEFKNVLKKRNYFCGKYIEIFILKNKKSENYLGIAVSKKTANSVERNRIKRYIRESFYKFEEDIKEGYSIVIMWKKKVEAKEASFHRIYNDLEYILNNAELLLK